MWYVFLGYSYIVFCYFFITHNLLLLKIKWENRCEQDEGNNCLISVDGTDFRIAELGKTFYSFKFKKSGLWYEVGICIKTGWIVWINGPYEPGIYNDLQFFRNLLKSFLGKGERVEADDGYIGEAPRGL